MFEVNTTVGPNDSAGEGIADWRAKDAFCTSILSHGNQFIALCLLAAP